MAVRHGAGGRIIGALVAVGLGLGCKKTSEGDRSSPACSEEPQDWLTWLIRDPAAPERFNSASEGWVRFYRRDYLEAVAAFASSAEGDAPVEQSGLARTHEALSDLYGRLAQLHARLLLAYFDARRQTGATPLAAAPELAVVSAALAGLAVPDWASGGRLRPRKLDCEGAAGSARDLVWQHLQCETPPACPERLAAHDGEEPWGPRLAAYGAALCGAADLAALRGFATAPAFRQTLSVPGEVVDSADVELFEPLALWTLSRVHAAAAREARPEPAPTDWMAYVFSPAPDGRTPPVADELRAARAAAAQWTTAVRAAKRCGGPGDGARLVDDLGLATTLADGALRRAAGSLLGRRRCDDALALLRETTDPASAEGVSYRNEPAFMVRWAAAAVCMRRLPEAIGVLRGVRHRFPEARGVLRAVEQLAVARVMGGVGGLQKRQ